MTYKNLYAICLLLVGLLPTLCVGAQAIIPAPPDLASSGYLLLDVNSGKVLVSHNEHQRLPPASLTKLMTSYIAASQLESSVIKLDDQVNISVKAWRMGGSKMYIREGTKVKLEDLLRGVIIQSGNDASVALAEHIAGGEDAFADLMNQQAAVLGMSESHFVNATGWPDEDHYSTAHDLALLSRRLIQDFPEHYKLYAEKYFTYANIRQPNRNNLLWRDRSVDGIKTGHTQAAGYCLVASAMRDGMRLISVVMGTASEESRAQETQKLLTYGFRYFETVNVYAKSEALSRVRVWKGAGNEVALGLSEALILTIPRGTSGDLSAVLDITRIIEAPVESGHPFGTVSVTSQGDKVFEGSLVALRSIEEAGFLVRLWDALLLFFYNLLGLDTLALT